MDEGFQLLMAQIRQWQIIAEFCIESGGKWEQAEDAMRRTQHLIDEANDYLRKKLQRDSIRED